MLVFILICVNFVKVSIFFLDLVYFKYDKKWCWVIKVLLVVKVYGFVVSRRFLIFLYIDLNKIIRKV